MIRTHVEFDSPIGKAADIETSRYALGALHITPAADGEVYCSATDSKQLTIKRLPGYTVPAGDLVPSAMVPRKRIGRKGLSVDRNGRWETSAGQFQDGDVEGRFPPCHQVVKVDTAGSIVLRIDPHMLAKMADSVGAKTVTLLLDRRVESVDDSRNPLNPSGKVDVVHNDVDSAVRVMFSDIDDSAIDAIGVIMPLHTDQPEASREAWETHSRHYVDTYSASYAKGKGQSPSGGWESVDTSAE